MKEVKTKKNIILECKRVFILFFIFKKQMLLEAKKPNMWTDLKKKERRGTPKKCTVKKLYRRQMTKKNLITNNINFE
jgi:hypothetical protein